MNGSRERTRVTRSRVDDGMGRQRHDVWTDGVRACVVPSSSGPAAVASCRPTVLCGNGGGRDRRITRA